MATSCPVYDERFKRARLSQQSQEPPPPCGPLLEKVTSEVRNDFLDYLSDAEKWSRLRVANYRLAIAVYSATVEFEATPLPILPEEQARVFCAGPQWRIAHGAESPLINLAHAGNSIRLRAYVTTVQPVNEELKAALKQAAHSGRVEALACLVRILDERELRLGTREAWAVIDTRFHTNHIPSRRMLRTGALTALRAGAYSEHCDHGFQSFLLTRTQTNTIIESHAYIMWTRGLLEAAAAEGDLLMVKLIVRTMLEQDVDVSRPGPMARAREAQENMNASIRELQCFSLTERGRMVEIVSNPSHPEFAPMVERLFIAPWTDYEGVLRFFGEVW